MPSVAFLRFWLGLPPLLSAAMGCTAVFGAASNTLLAPVLFGIEIFGESNIIYFVLICLLAYAFNGKQSVYTGQQRYSHWHEQRVKERKN